MRHTPASDLALLVVAIALMLGGAVVLFGGWLSAGIAIPAIAIGIALVVVVNAGAQRRERHTPHPLLSPSAARLGHAR